MEYRGYTIVKDQRNPYGPAEYMFFLTEEGEQHDADYEDDSYHYTGNCKWASTEEEAKGMIDDILSE